MAVHLVTFGGLHAATDDGGELSWLLSQHSRAALLVYLAVERRVSREALTAVFWPESHAENARHALRQSLYQLRKAVGVEWIESRAHELVVGDSVDVDAHDYARAIERGDAESAVRLYRGPFLDGVHLVDLKPWESWVDARRAQYARDFRKANRGLLDARRAAGDPAGAVAAAERWVRCDPSDDEAQHRLIEALATAGERAEAIRQYETYARMLEPDGLEPLDETKALAERLRAESAPLQTLRAPAVAVAPAAAESAAPATGPMSASLPARRRTAPLPLLAVLALVALVGTTWGVLQRERARAPSSTPGASTIAVLPFAVRGDASVRYLGEGMVDLLAAALDGAGSLRPVDVRATLAAVADAGGTTTLDLARAGRVAGRLGAPLYVLGDVVGAGGTVQIQGSVYRAGGRAAPMATAVVSGPADSVFALVDRLAARLLGGLGDPAADRLLRTASLTTTSLPALKAYLEGEGLMRAGQFERAADAYLAAVALDSTFAVAHYRLALAREWAPLPGNADAASAAARFGTRLSTHDRMLLEAFSQWRTGAAAEAERGYREILARYPDDVDAWFQLGEIQFHYGPLVGHPVDESEVAWRRVLSYEPRNLFALTHLARLAAVAGRAGTLDSLLAPFGVEKLRADRRLEELVVLRATTRGDAAAARALAREVRRGESFSVWRVAVFLTAFSPDPAITHGVIQELIEDYPNRGLRADLYWFASLLELAGGRAGAADSSLARAVAAERMAPKEHGRWGYEAATRWFAATLPLPYADSTLERARRDAASPDAFAPAPKAAFEGELGIGTPLRMEPLRQYTLGTLSLRLRDTAAASVAAAKLQRLAKSGDATSLVRDLDRGLRAALAFQRRRPDDALRLLDALECRDEQGDVAATPFVSRANERLLRAEVLASLGRDADALRWLASLGTGSVTELPVQALSHLRQAEIYERRGDRGRAAAHYARFVALWRDADPDFRPLVDGARRRLSELGRGATR